MEIQHLHRQGLGPSQIARRVGLDRKTVATYLKRPVTDTLEPVVQVPRQRSSKVDPFAGYLKERLDAFPELFAETLYQEITARGYTGSARTLRRYLAWIRTKRARRIYRPVETPPGRQAQVDWGHFGTILHHGVIRHLYAFVLVLSWSRQRYVEFTVSQDMATFLACHARALAALGGVPAEIVYDNAKTVVRDRVGSIVQFTPDLLRFALAYGFKPRACWTYDPESKGKVESAVKYVRRSFFYGRNFKDLDDLNQQARLWTEEVANQKPHSATGEAPAARLEQERKVLKPLPSHTVDTGVTLGRRVSKTGLVTVDGNRYSAPASLQGSRVQVRLTEAEVQIYADREPVASHPRNWGKGQTLLQAAHYEGRITPARAGAARGLQARFEAMGPAARDYLRGLATSQHEHLSDQAKAILELAETYGTEAILRAMERAMQFRAYGSGILRRILEKAEREPGALPQLPIPRPPVPLPGVPALQVEQRDLAAYALAAARED